ncbi:MAG: hypothetical protein U0V70_12485 [Terriglobia bacterium]
MKRSWTIVILVLVITLSAGVWFYLQHRSRPGSLADIKSHPELSPSFLSALKHNQPIAMVGATELKTNELRDYLLLTYQGQMTQAVLPKSEQLERISTGLDRLIDEELLAQAALKAGLKSSQKGIEEKRDLAQKYLESQLAKEPKIDDAQLRDFYKNHGEKFFIPGGVQLREFFIPYTGKKGKTGKADSALDLAGDLARRLAQGEQTDALIAEFIPEAYRGRAEIHLYKGSTIQPADDQKVLRLGSKEVAGPFRNEGGYSVFLAVSSERNRFIPFSEAKGKIQSFLETRRLELLRQKIVDQLRHQVPIQRYEIDQLVSAS